MPTDSRTRSPGTSSGEPAALAWVIRPGCSISDSTPPSDSPSTNSLARLQIADRRLLAADGAEAHHAAEAAHLLRRDLVSGVLGQARVEHLGDLRVPGQELHDPLGVVAVPVHPYAERLDAAQGQPGVERAG